MKEKCKRWLKCFIYKLIECYKGIRITDWIQITVAFIMICQLLVLTGLSLIVVKNQRLTVNMEQNLIRMEKEIISWKPLHQDNHEMLTENREAIIRLEKTNDRMCYAIKSCMQCHKHPFINHPHREKS